MTVTERLFALADEDYKSFNTRLMPTVDPETVIGVRVPHLRNLAKEMRRSPEAEQLIRELPHTYFEEYLLHGFLLSYITDFDRCALELDKLLPYLDCWALTDSISPPVFKRNKKGLLPWIDTWLSRGDTYSVRYGILMLMKHYLGDDFRPEYMERVAAVRSDEYYVNMAVAWYFATALASQLGHAIKYFESGSLSPWIHAKAIQKACESCRISREVKDYLKSLR